MVEPGREQSRRLDIAVSSGTGTGNTVSVWDVSRWIRCIPPNESTQYDLTLKDGDGHIILKYTGQVGTFSGNLEISLGVLKSALIENATADGTFTLKMDLH